MRRREFITLLGGAAAWPLAARAQQAVGMRRVAALSGWSESDPEAQADAAVFRSELEKLGWIEDRNLHIDFRYGEGDADRMRKLAAELVKLAPDVIFTVSRAATRAAKQQTQTIPIVVAGAGPLGNEDLGPNMARPEGNVTGFANTIPSMTGKWLGLLKEIVPHLIRVGYVVRADSGQLANPANVASARTLGVEWIEAPFQTLPELDRAVHSFAAESNGGLIINSGVVTLREDILRLAARYRLPMIAGYRSYVEGGGLVSYGSQPTDWFRAAASYVDRILRGAKPSELPIQFASRFELVINLKTARALGLDVPPTLLARADEVIE